MRTAQFPYGQTEPPEPPKQLAIVADGAEVLREQLEYLIQFADQEGDRLSRVKAILLETFR